MRLLSISLGSLVVLGIVAGCGTDPSPASDTDASVDSGGSSSSGGSAGTGGSAITGGNAASSACDGITCKSPAVCDDSGSKPICACPGGYTDDNGDGSKCTDIDECADSSLNNCALRATCENTKGGFSCTCDAPAYKGDGATCTCASGYAVAADDATVCLSDNGGSCADELDCASGFCVGGICCETGCVNPPACYDPDSATCDDGSTCAYPEKLADGSACEDGDACTSATCKKGVCGDPVDISGDCPSTLCKPGSCDSLTGCTVSSSTALCDDGDPCTVGETCQPDGTCGSGTPYVCTDDGNPCTDEVCQDNGGSPACITLNNNDYCGGGSCVTEDQCSGGTCQVGGGIACGPCDTSGTDPCGYNDGWATGCTDNQDGTHTCACDSASGFTELYGRCVCDMEGTFAVQVTATLKFDGAKNPLNSNEYLLAPFDNVVVHSWIMRSHTLSGTDVLVTEQPCGGETPESCSGLSADVSSIKATESYLGNVPNASWDSPGMPKFDGQTFSLDIAVPGNAFITGNEAMVSGLIMQNNDLLGAWPADPAAVVGWTNPDGDSYDGVETIWQSGSKSTVCPRGATASFDVTLPPVIDGVAIKRVKYVDGASRIIKSYDGQIDDCNTLSGTVKGPSQPDTNHPNVVPGQYAPDAIVRDCRHANGSDCSDNEVQSLNNNVTEAPYVKSATFLMKRMTAGATHTCAEVRAQF